MSTPRQLMSISSYFELSPVVVLVRCLFCYSSILQECETRVKKGIGEMMSCIGGKVLDLSWCDVDVPWTSSKNGGLRPTEVLRADVSNGQSEQPCTQRQSIF
jgi:hypothetical protein